MGGTGNARFAGRRVAVSGAGGGIGRAVARRFAAEGAALVLIDCDAAALAECRAEAGGQAVTVLCDQTRPEEVERAVAEAGGVDVFVNNAGVILRKPLLDTRPEELERVMAVNATGCMAMAIGMARAMGARGGGGVIVNVSSQLAFMGAAERGVYGASKAALVQFTRTAGVEWIGQGIRVVGVAPGPVESPMTAALQADAAQFAAFVARSPIGRMIRADEIAEIVAFLASPMAATIVGQTIIADGGWSLT